MKNLLIVLVLIAITTISTAYSVQLIISARNAGCSVYAELGEIFINCPIK
ncbi:MAG: hypothetical protein PHY29_03010 [Syntrophales bacterium]|nr:hypothetical protein [Syntrophales bacterium]